MKRMKLGLLIAGGWGLLGCAGKVLPPHSAAQGAPLPPLEAKLCADWVLASRGLLCQRLLTTEEQAHRGVSYRLWYRGPVVERLERINGRGFPESDDNGCSERRFRFEDGYVAESTGYRQDGRVCDRALFTDHASHVRYVDEWGRPEYRNDRTYTGAIYERDADGVIIKMRPLASDGSPGSINGAAEVRYERNASHYETRACSFDVSGKPTLNDSGVHCYSHERDASGNDIRQASFGLDGRAVTDPDGSQSTVRRFDPNGNLLKATRLGLDGKPVRSPFIRCVSFGYHYDSNGFRTGADCLSETDELADFDQGNARWIATPDARGRSREVRYFDRYGAPITSAVGFARTETDRDDLGHLKEQRYFLADGTPGQKEDGAAVVRFELDASGLETRRSFFNGRGAPQAVKGCAAYTYEYDRFRDLTRQSCRSAAGELVAGRDKVSVTVWRYDAQGQLAEVQYLDPAGKPVDGRGGFARKVLGRDARGKDVNAQHFKADGSLLPLRRFSVLWVHPPYSDGFWPARSRDEMAAVIEQARRELLAGLPWSAAVVRFGDERVTYANPGDTGYLNLETLFPVAREALEPLNVGEYSRVVEMPFGFALYLRTE